jgi:signal transduction histidine kinase
MNALSVLLLVGGPAALVMRRRYPTTVLIFVLGTTLTYFLLDYPRGPIFLALIVAYVGAVMSGRRIAAMATLAAGYLAFLWLGLLLGVGNAPGTGEALGVAAWLLVLAAIAELARGRRDRGIEYARVRREETRRRASEERLRIARELHDVLAHNISLMNVQAGVALHLMDEQPEQARTALAAIKAASNDALDELRSVLDILRQTGEEPPRSPTSGLADVGALISRSERAGVQISEQIEGPPRPLPAKVDLAAFRIIQEALTNITRHAPKARASVRIHFASQDLIVQVDSDGQEAPRPSGGGGNGIRGMRERAAALGGEVEAGPRPGGGFRVRARLPFDSPQRAGP